MLEWFLRLMDNMSRLIDWIFVCAGAVGGFLITRPVLAAFEVGPVMQYVGAVGGAIVAALLVWIVWSVMKLLGGG